MRGTPAKYKKPRLTAKQKAYADLYIKTMNGTKSAAAVYDVSNYNSAGAISSQNLSKLRVQEYIAGCAAIAANNVFKLANEAKNENVQLNANKDILDRAGFKPVEKHETLSLNKYVGSIDITTLALSTAQQLQQKKLLE